MKKNNLGTEIFRGTMVIIVLSIIAKVVAFVSEAVLAAKLGLNYESDAYYMVSGIHQVLYPMMSVGIWKVFLPIYKEKMTRQEVQEAGVFANKSISFFMALSVVWVAVLIVFCNQVVSIVAPGFAGDTKELCVQLVRISAPMYFFTIIAAIYAAMLQCKGAFLGSQIREVVSHIPTIIAALWLYGRFGVQALAYALIAGSVLRLLIELPFVNWGYRFRFDLRFRDADFRLMLKRVPSALLSEGVQQINTLVDKAMASLLSAGTVACLNYGHKLVNVFSGLLSSAVATAMYPQMVELVTLGEREKLSKMVAKVINIFAVMMVPVTLACILFREELVTVAFGRGNFTTNAIHATASVFALYSMSMFFSACGTIVSNLFFSCGDTKTPLKLNCAMLLLNFILNIFFMKIWGADGLALATSLTAIIVTLIKFRCSRTIVRIPYASIALCLAKILPAAAIACIFAKWLAFLLTSNVYLGLVLAVILGCIVYIPLLYALKIKELKDVLKLVKRRMP